jgi:hypothetical protein
MHGINTFKHRRMKLHLQIGLYGCLGLRQRWVLTFLHLLHEWASAQTASHLSLDVGVREYSRVCLPTHSSRVKGRHPTDSGAPGVATSHALLPLTQMIRYLVGGGTRGRSWVRHYATSRRVTGSISDKVLRFFS